MISETRLARGYASFWRGVAPTMELFVKRCNLDIYERNFEPLQSSVSADRRAIVNQFAFEMFGLVPNDASAGNIRKLIAADDVQIAAGAMLDVKPDEIDGDEVVEARELAFRMWSHFHIPRPTLIAIKPLYRGCGIVVSCIGDVQTQSGCIVEMKDGDRPFRSYEFRQLSIYAALYYNERGVSPEQLQVVNSRRGTAVTVSTEAFAREVAGQSAADYLYGIVRMISENSTSQ